MSANLAKLAFILATLCCLAVTVACDSSPGSLAAAQRPIAAQMPVEQRHSLRKLPFEGAHNFRDLGGYKTADGRQIKWGQIYRSDTLADLTTEDTVYLERLGLTRIIDFRSTQERDVKPNKLAANSTIKVEHLPITVSGANFEFIKQKIESGDFSRGEMQQLLIDANREFVEKYTIIYRAWINSLLEPNALPMAFHCSAGKDRTGFGAALILLALGVPEHTVMEDYLASNRYTADRTERLLLFIKVSSLFQADTDALRPLFGVEPEFLQEAFKAIKEHYGSMDNYLEKGLGLDSAKRKQLRDIMTEPA